MTKKKTSERFTLIQRSLLRLTLEMEQTVKATRRSGVERPITELVVVPQILEQILALESLGRELLERQPKDVVFKALAKHATEDSRAVTALQEGDEDDVEECPHCEEPICSSCGLCHKCGGHTTPPDHSSLN